MNFLLNKASRAFEIWKKRGIAGIFRRLQAPRRAAREEKRFRQWIARHRIGEKERREMRAKIAQFPSQPLVSVIVPVYNVEEDWLRECIESVVGQLYTNWELCLADDNSPGPHVRRVLEEYAARDARIKTVFRATNGHISAASNSALELATGEFSVLLDHDDKLTEDALFRVVEELNRYPETAFIYSDEDKIDERGARFMPHFKPDFSRDLFYSLNLTTHLSAYRTEILRAVGGFRAGFEGSQDYDLALRVIEQIDERQIRHIPKILYHWRAISGSVALASDEKPYAHERARAALREHFARTCREAEIERGYNQMHRARYHLPAELPKVSLILSAFNHQSVEESVAQFLAKTDYQNLEVILICSRAISGKFQVISNENLSRAASFNRAATRATGEILCFADARLLPLSPDWLKELTSFAIQKEIGAVGGKIIAADETIAEAGLILGFGGTAGAAHGGLEARAPGYFGRAVVIGNFSAVSAQCLAVRRGEFEAAGGFDAENLPQALFDADFCLRLGARGLRVLFTPYAELAQTGKSARRGKPAAAEKEYFRRKWQSVIERDPFYNPNLSQKGETFTIKI